MHKDQDIDIKKMLKMKTYAQFNVDDFFVFLKQFREFFLEDTFFYRGQADATWGLESSYERSKKSKGNTLFTSDYLDNQCDSFLFRGELSAIKYYLATNDSFRNSRHPKLEILSEMQHYGASTRLLDITESFGVALFFALAKNTKDKDAAVWAINKRLLFWNCLLAEYHNAPLQKKEKYYLFNPHDKKKTINLENIVVASFSKNEWELNELLCDFAEELIGNKDVIRPPDHYAYTTVYPGAFPVRPMFFNNRLCAQNGLFLLQQSLEHSFMENLLSTLNISPSEFEKDVSSADTPNISEAEYDSDLLNTALVKFIIPQSEFKSCESVLKTMYINYKSLFPDKYGIIKNAEKKYFPE